MTSRGLSFAGEICAYSSLMPDWGIGVAYLYFHYVDKILIYISALFTVGVAVGKSHFEGIDIICYKIAPGRARGGVHGRR